MLFASVDLKDANIKVNLNIEFSKSFETIQEKDTRQVHHVIKWFYITSGSIRHGFKFISLWKTMIIHC